MMTKRMMLKAVLAGALVASGVAVEVPAYADTVEVVSATCFTRGQALATQRGAQLVGAEAVEQNGRPACRIILLVPGQNGERPRREVVFVDR